MTCRSTLLIASAATVYALVAPIAEAQPRRRDAGARATADAGAGAALDAGVASTPSAPATAAAVTPALRTEIEAMAARSGVAAARLGETRQGWNADGGVTPIRYDLAGPRCYLFLATAQPSVTQLELRLFRDGREVVRHTRPGRRAAVDLCVPRRTPVELRVRVAEGNGYWVAAQYAYASRDLLATVGTPGRTSMPSQLALAEPAPGATADAGAARPIDETLDFPPNLRVGGAASGRIPDRIRAAHAAVAQGRRPITDVLGAQLQTAQSREHVLELRAGACYSILAAGMPSISNLDLALFDPLGNRLAEDETTDAEPRIEICPPVPGRYRLVVRVFSGYGRYGVQVFGARR
ncbi:MAG: hypothetical protein IT379_36285 [Deltaproteobacteria bacterium]|nr:hypothetical protein [Deltaproteobacteria bacterium]